MSTNSVIARTAGDGLDTEAIVADYLAGMDVHALAAKYHRRKSTMSVVLKEAGVLGELHKRAWLAKRGRGLRVLVNRGAGIGGTLTDTDWAYIAGVFDGEGSLTLEQTVYRVTIAQKVDSGLLHWLRATLGAGFISSSLGGTNKDVGAYRIVEQRAVFEFLLGVQPYVIVKRARVETVLVALAKRYGWDAPAQAEKEV